MIAQGTIKCKLLPKAAVLVTSAPHFTVQTWTRNGKGIRFTYIDMKENYFDKLKAALMSRVDRGVTLTAASVEVMRAARVCDTVDSRTMPARGPEGAARHRSLIGGSAADRPSSHSHTQHNQQCIKQHVKDN